MGILIGIYAHADKGTFAVLSPRGGPTPFPLSLFGYSFNAGGCCPDSTPCVDHVGAIPRFVEAARLALLPADLDMHRIFVMGLSNGAMMASRAACIHPGIFAAVATVSGVLVPHAAEDID